MNNDKEQGSFESFLRGEEKERARCLEICKRFALACRVSEERSAQEGKHDDAKEFSERAKAAEAIAAELELEP